MLRRKRQTTTDPIADLQRDAAIRLAGIRAELDSHQDLTLGLLRVTAERLQ